MGQAAQVVAAEGGIDDIVGFEQHAAQPLVARIGGGFVLEDRNRPALLLGPSDLVIPVRALDQAHADRRAGRAPSGSMR